MKTKLCIITTAPQSLSFFCPDLTTYLAGKEYEITCLAGPGEKEHRRLRKQGVRTVVLPFHRTIHLARDFWCLLRLWFWLFGNRFDIIHASTPKAMLLGTLAAFLSGHRTRIVTIHGRIYENKRGVTRGIYTFLDNIAYRLARIVIPVCKELGSVIIQDGCSGRKVRFLGASCNGVDGCRFKQTPSTRQKAVGLRQEMGISADHVVILFVGRLRAEKGINELVRAFQRLNASEGEAAHLVLVGAWETGVDPLAPDVVEDIERNPRIHCPGSQEDVVPWYTMADIVAFPSYREGFGNVSIEAAAMELPVVGTDIMGIREGISDGETGLLVPPGEVEPLAEALRQLIDDPALRRRFGKAGRQRVLEEFRPEDRWNGIFEVYEEVLAGTTR